MDDFMIVCPWLPERRGAPHMSIAKWSEKRATIPADFGKLRETAFERLEVVAALLSPAEEAEGDGKGADGVGGEDGELGPDGGERVPLEHDAAEGLVEGSERQGVDQRLNFGGEALGGEKDAGEDPHREHHEVHHAGDGLNGLCPAGDKQADAGEGGAAEQDHGG